MSSLFGNGRKSTIVEMAKFKIHNKLKWNISQNDRLTKPLGVFSSAADFNINCIISEQMAGISDSRKCSISGAC